MHSFFNSDFNLSTIAYFFIIFTISFFPYFIPHKTNSILICTVSLLYLLPLHSLAYKPPEFTFYH